MSDTTLPFVTGYPTAPVRAEINATGPELWANLVQTWCGMLQYYLALPPPTGQISQKGQAISPSMRLFLETYVVETAAATQNSETEGSRQGNEGGEGSRSDLERRLRQTVFALITKQNEDRTKYAVLDAMTYKAVWAFVACYGAANHTEVSHAIAYLYTARGGKTFVTQLAAVAIDQLAAGTAEPTHFARTLSVVLLAGPGIAPDWVTLNWVDSLQSVYIAPGVSARTQRAVLQACWASFCVPPLAVLDSNARLSVLGALVSKATRAPLKHGQMLGALLNYTNFGAAVGVPSLSVTLETARLRIPVVPSPATTTRTTSKSTKATKSQHDSSTTKGKGKSTASNLAIPIPDDTQVSLILDLFPQLNGPAVAKLLAQNGGSAEVATAFLLENSESLAQFENYVPEAESAPSQPQQNKNKNKQTKVPSPPTAPAASKLRSVYDNDDLSTLKIDPSKLIFGKKAPVSMSSLGQAYSNDAKGDSSLQATLQRIYQADEDERDDTYDEAEAAHSTSIQTVSDSTADAGVDAVTRRPKLNHVQADSAAETPAVEGASSPADATERLLWETYAQSPGEFAQAARRTRARADLCKATGWSNEQIEGWARMLDRMPKRKTMLSEKYAFRGNSAALKPSTRYRQPKPEESDGEDDASTSNQQHTHTHTQNQRKQNPHAPPTTTKQQQQRKDRNKAKQGNHNRKAGHDRKMQRAGPAP